MNVSRHCQGNDVERNLMCLVYAYSFIGLQCE